MCDPVYKNKLYNVHCTIIPFLIKSEGHPQKINIQTKCNSCSSFFAVNKKMPVLEHTFLNQQDKKKPAQER